MNSIASGETTCDLHLHSSASRHTEEWYSRYFQCPESFIPPEDQYALCKARGMSLVTLTDHDTIEGGLTLLDRPDFFLSEEVTARFPHNGCVVHVLVWGLTPAQHEVIQRLRADVNRLVPYLQAEELAHALAHPLFSPNGKMDAPTFERALTLFTTLEGMNGLVDRRTESDLATILGSLTQEARLQLARRHGNRHPSLARWAFCAGSDDHVHRRAGAVYTAVAQPGLTIGAYLAAVMAGEGSPRGGQATLATMVASVNGTAQTFLRQGRGRDHTGDPLVDFLRVAGLLGQAPASLQEEPLAPSFLRKLVTWAKVAAPTWQPTPTPPATTEQPAVADAGTLGAALDQQDEQGLSVQLDLLADGVRISVPALTTSLVDFSLNDALDILRDMGGLLLAAAPFLFAAEHFGRQQAQCAGLRAQWTASRLPHAPEALALFSDTLTKLDGVATWCHRFVAQAADEGRRVVVPVGARLGRMEDSDVFHELPCVANFPLPFYSEMQMDVLSPCHVVSWLWRERVTHTELASPGPVGLVGLLASKILHLPSTATYHTEIPDLICRLGGGPRSAGAAQRYLRFFYSSVDKVLVYSERARRSLVALGVAPQRIHLLPLTVDPRQFSPEFSDKDIFRELGVPLGKSPAVLCVGRLSAEKNIPLIVKALRELQHDERPPSLVVVGDGPERDAWRKTFSEDRFVHFVGPRRGETLRRLYASAQAFAFASTTDTLGLVNLEAMASGLPVLAPTASAVAELATHGQSAHFYCLDHTAAGKGGTNGDGKRDGLACAVRRVLTDKPYARHLGTNARSAMVERWERFPFSELWRQLTAAPH